MRPWTEARARLERFRQLDLKRVPSPCFVVDEVAIEENCRLLAHVQQASGAKVLAALKAFSMWSLAPLVARQLSGTCASGLHEARLGREEYGGEVHTFCAAFTERELREVLKISDHVVFNSQAQWRRFQTLALSAQRERPGLRYGLRVNPENSEGAVALYDPCAPCSRLGIPRAEFRADQLEGISGLHFHALCEQDFPPLERTVAAFEAKFGEFIPRMEWINFGGGHHITRFDYQVDALIALLKDFRARHGVALYLEPGEAVAYHAGVLVAEVLDLPFNGMPLAILDTSATCHMPDVIEMPYRPNILGAGEPDSRPHTYRLGGQTCLAGDVIGDYAFDAPLRIGQRLVFEDMAYYTMVKTTTFNGINLPSIAIWNSRTDALRVVRSFGYQDFKGRLS
ncbi:MAG: carboxynorspermidine decarboxylase [Betaproteobacteria bacterium]|nr:carboxynorspermidine decarboxylase [Betaproteobacteria bacterium]